MVEGIAVIVMNIYRRVYLLKVGDIVVCQLVVKMVSIPVNIAGSISGL